MKSLLINNITETQFELIKPFLVDSQLTVDPTIKLLLGRYGGIDDIKDKSPGISVNLVNIA